MVTVQQSFLMVTSPATTVNEHWPTDILSTAILFWIWWKVNGNWDKNMIRISEWREGHYRINNSIRKKKEIQQSRTVRITVWDPTRKVNHPSIWQKVIWDYWKIITEFTKPVSSARIGNPVLMMDVKVTKDKHICRWVDLENLINVRWNRIKNRAQKQRMWSIEEKEVRHWVK